MMNTNNRNPVSLKQEVIDKDENFIPLTEIMIYNIDARNEFVNRLVNDGKTIKYIKGHVNGRRMNVGMECNETGEQLAYEWARRVKEEQVITPDDIGSLEDVLDPNDADVKGIAEGDPDFMEENEEGLADSEAEIYRQ